MRGNNKQNYLFNIRLFYPLDNEQCLLNLSPICRRSIELGELYYFEDYYVGAGDE